MCKIEFNLERPTFVIIKVVDIMGNVVGTVLKDHRAAGFHKIDFNEENLMPGRYYYKIFLSDSNFDSIEKQDYSKLWKTGKVQIDHNYFKRFMDL